MFVETIWVERDRYHTAIVCERGLIERLAPRLTPLLGDAPLVRFGWGDREYYGSARKSFYKAFKALLLPTRSVIEVSCFEAVEELGKNLIAIETKLEALQGTIDFIARTFKWDKSDEVKLVREEENGFRYYRARGFYHGLRNCNNWTAKALKKGDVEIKYLFSFSAKSVMKQLD